jgi:hypothetical protein
MRPSPLRSEGPPSTILERPYAAPPPRFVSTLASQKYFRIFYVHDWYRKGQQAKEGEYVGGQRKRERQIRTRQTTRQRK